MGLTSKECQSTKRRRRDDNNAYLTTCPPNTANKLPRLLDTLAPYSRRKRIWCLVQLCPQFSNAFLHTIYRSSFSLEDHDLSRLGFIERLRRIYRYLKVVSL
jgi:hypothetical protein